MNKIISYSLFKGPDPLAEIFYIRGFYFNCLMNSLVYPDWNTIVHVDRYTFEKYQDLFTHLIANYSIKVQIIDGEYTHCQKMLWRMMPVFWEDSEYVICRDADALTSVREACAVKQWVESGLPLHNINDNTAHTLPLMGGLCGFKAEGIRNGFENWDKMLTTGHIAIHKHGTDQIFLNKVIYDANPESLFTHISGGGYGLIWKTGVARSLVTDVTNPLWTSDLCTSFIGAAGFNEMETLRFFRSNLPNWGSDQDLWKQYHKIFYWHE